MKILLVLILLIVAISEGDNNCSTHLSKFKCLKDCDCAYCPSSGICCPYNEPCNTSYCYEDWELSAGTVYCNKKRRTEMLWLLSLPAFFLLACVIFVICKISNSSCSRSITDDHETSDGEDIDLSPIKDEDVDLLLMGDDLDDENIRLLSVEDTVKD